MVMENRYFARNPFLARPPRARDNQGIGGAARIYPVSRNKVLADHHAGTFTASCGIRVYRGNLLPEAYLGDVFTCDPTGNLVHQEHLVPKGATFEGLRVREGVEFLASPDNWFRPVMLSNGPDGALYVVDMYREEVEHPHWVPAEYMSRYNFDHRKDFGRIWRIVPEKGELRRLRPRLKSANILTLVRLLEHPGAWWRMTAQRLLIERQDKSAVGPLRELAAESKSPLGRAHAAWTLEGLGALDGDLVVRLLGDLHPPVRENALRLSERFIGHHEGVQAAVLGLASDGDARVRFRAALALGEWDSDRKLEALAWIGLMGAEDPYTRLAVQSAVPKRAGGLVWRAGSRALSRELAVLIGSRADRKEIVGLLEDLNQKEWAHPVEIMIGLAEGLGRRGKRLEAFLDHAGANEARKVTGAFVSMMADAAIKPEVPGSERAAAIGLLAHARWEQAGSVLKQLLEDSDGAVRLAAVRSLAAHRHATVAVALMKPWRLYLPAERREVLEAMTRRSDRIAILLDEIEAKRVAPGELGTPLVKRLRDHKDKALRARARKLLQQDPPAERKEVLAQYRKALKLKGDVARGAEVFRKNCASCHRLGGIGTHVGPNIADTFRRTPEALMVDILDPSRAIDNNYVNYLVRTKSGTVLSGFVAEQTAASITLRRGADQQDAVLRADIDQMKSSGTSLMPEGLEKNIPIAAMADLLAFLKGGWRKR